MSYRVVFAEGSAPGLVKLTEAEVEYVTVDVALALARSPHDIGVLMHADPPRSFYFHELGPQVRMGYVVDDSEREVVIEDFVVNR